MRRSWMPTLMGLLAAAWISAAPERGPAPAAPAAPAWSELGPSGGDIRGFAVNPVASKKLVAVSRSGQVFGSKNSGASWTRTARPSKELFDVACAPGRPAVLYALGLDAVFRSDDGGRTWQRRPLPSGGGGDEGRLAVHPKLPDTLFVAGRFHSGSSTWMAAFKTVNGGKSWSAAKLAAETRKGLARGVAIDCLNPSTVYVCGGYEDLKKYYIFKSADAGTTWNDVTGTVQGIPRDIAVDPALSSTVFVTTSTGFYQSRDGGRTWQFSGGDGFGRALALSPTRPPVFFTSFSALWVYKSPSGYDWTHLETGFNGDTRRLASAPGTIYLASISGLIKSIDGGVTWRSCQAGIKATRVAAVAPAPSSSNLLYTVAYEQGVSKSLDAGRTWTLLWPVFGCESIPALSVHPQKPSRLIVLLESG